MYVYFCIYMCVYICIYKFKIQQQRKQNPNRKALNKKKLVN